MEAIEQEEKARRAIVDPYFWLTECTKTADEQDKTNPFKPFPKWPFFEPLWKLILSRQITFIEKSRTMMCSWGVAGIFAWLMFNRPLTSVVFQSQDEDRAVHDVDYVKTLWDQSIPPLKARWKTKDDTSPWRQSYNYFELANGSYCIGISGNPDKSRSLHPTVFVLDEAAFMVNGDEIFHTVLAARPLHLVALSSANNGWFREATERAVATNWPAHCMPTGSFEVGKPSQAGE